MEDREMPRMHKYGESKMTRIMMVSVHHVTSGLGLSGHLNYVGQSVHLQQSGYTRNMSQTAT